MGQCNCVQTEESQLDHKISRELKQDAQQYSKTYKVLLIGTENSGKSTLFKQLKQIYGYGLCHDDSTYIFYRMYQLL